MWALGHPPSERRVIAQPWGAPPEGGPVLYVLALDPGVVSGWAALRMDWAVLRQKGFHQTALGGPALCAWRCGELHGPEPYQAELFLALARGLWSEGEWEAGEDSDLFLVVIEDFVLRMFSADRELLAPVRITAMVEALSWRSLPPPVVLTSALDAFKTMPDERLRAHNLYAAGGKDHQRDATRHAALGARRMLEPKFRTLAVQRMAWLHQNSESNLTIEN